MARLVAFLGAINVGGRRVAMADLVREFESLGFDDVSTLVASGNVVFSTRERSVEAATEARLRAALGHEVPTWGRTGAHASPSPARRRSATCPGTVAVGFLKQAPTKDAAVAALGTPVDTLQVVGTELWWHLPKGFSGSKLTARTLERAGRGPLTTRNMNTIGKLAARLA